MSLRYLPEEMQMPLSGTDIMDVSLPKMLAGNRRESKSPCEELRYCRSFPGEQFRWVTRSLAIAECLSRQGWAMSRNGHVFDETGEAKVAAFNALYRDVSHGDGSRGTLRDITMDYGL